MRHSLRLTLKNTVIFTICLDALMDKIVRKSLAVEMMNAIILYKILDYNKVQPNVLFLIGNLLSMLFDQSISVGITE